MSKSFDRIAKAAREAQAMVKADANGWLTIETAPKDGTWFLGWRQRQFEEDCVSVWSWYAYSPVSGLWIDADDQNDADDQPTHWQPLPKPPVLP
jgi:hypothetical protein